MKSSMFDITCIMPVKNGIKYLDQAISSLQNQRIKLSKILIIDDHSTDNLKEFLQERDLIDCYFSSPGNGLAAALNYGILQSKTEFIAFLDSDDVWTENHLDVLAEPFLKNTSLEITYGRTVNVDENLLNPTKIEMTRLLGSSLFRRSCFKKGFNFDESLTHGPNIDFLQKLYSTKPQFMAVDQTVLFRRIHKNNMGHDTTQARKDLLRIVRRKVNSK